MKILLVLLIVALFCLFLPYSTSQAQHTVCGNGVCEGGEDCENCAQDCGVCYTNSSDNDTGNDTSNDTGNDTGDNTNNATPPTTIESQLEMEQLKIKRTSEFSLKGGVIDNLRILWP